MKYENPTCEIVLLDKSDLLTASGDAITIKKNDSPYVDYPNY